MERALAAMSGGVDSSVAAYLLKQKGYDCIGVMMKLVQSDIESVCCSLEDAEDARSAAARIGIPFYVFNFTDDFEENVICRFVSSYERGRTPNPCVDCNRFLKFGSLYRRAAELGRNYIATGHYARIERDNGGFKLKKASDLSKDQSYFLYHLTQEQLSRTIFPLGELTKDEVRRIAASEGFPNAEKPDSQDICFAPDGDYASFIERYTGKIYPEGDFISPEGKILGRHKGIIHYTVGQRRGLGVSADSRLYVIKIDARDNTITLGGKEFLSKREVFAGDFFKTTPAPLEKSFRCSAKIRCRHREQPCSVTLDPGSGEFTAVFDSPQNAVTPGQFIVLYDGDTVLGGGMIMDGQSD